MENKKYSREIEGEINKNLENDKVLLLLGARQVGKTTVLKKIRDSLEKQGKKTEFLNLEKNNFRDILDNDPENIFQLIGNNKEKTYVFIDEIQYLKNPSNFLKLLYDNFSDKIKLIVTGSSAFYIDKKFKDSLAGRKKIFYIYTLSFNEFLDFKDKIEYKEFLGKKDIPLLYKTELFNLYYEFINYGSYPELVLMDSFDEKIKYLKEIADSYIQKDIFEAKIEFREKYFYILKILASQIGNLLNMNEIANMVNLSVSTVENYIYIMRKSFHISAIKPFHTNIKKEFTKMPKVYFFDLGLRNYFAGNFDNFNLRVDKGSLLENLVYKNFLGKYNYDEIKFWRTQNKNEIDFILEKDKKAFEVKFNLKKFNIKKYSLFLEKYGDFSLECIDLEKSLTIFGKKTGITKKKLETSKVF
ncbi:ATP-binding protein [Candidatus Gracilibacteria bacterium]|nr:ATP-binding protein [Candidatus Gracilibacteria bacterium]